MEIVIHTILSRASVKSVGDPGPGDADLRLIFEAAVRAPDHGKLRPWRFFVIRGDARRQLSELFVAGVKRREPGATEAQIEKERDKPLARAGDDRRSGEDRGGTQDSRD